MKKLITIIVALFLMMTSVLCTLVVCYADEKEESVATQEETTDRAEVGEPGMVEVAGSDVEDGEYDIEVESDSGMFNIVSTKLTVKAGSMTCVMTLHGDGYKALYQGNPKKALKADGKDIAEAKVVNGDYTYEFKVPSLNTKVDLSALSKKYNKWYGHKVVFQADSLPKGAVKIDLDKNKLDVKDGEYTIEVKLEGGTGRADITSPADIIVEDGIATASIEWSSPNYDYMIVNGEKYLNQNQGEGNSLFEIPVTGYDEPVEVIADTTAMSQPHEIEYTLTFDRDSVKGKSPFSNIDPGMIGIICGAAGLVVIILIIMLKRRRK